jgi:hypothetical protein
MEDEMEELIKVRVYDKKTMRLHRSIDFELYEPVIALRAKLELAQQRLEVTCHIKPDDKASFLALTAANLELQAENAALRGELEKERQDNQITYCAYCGERFALDDAAASLVSEHIRKCLKHPMRAVETELRAEKTKHSWTTVKLEVNRQQVTALKAELKYCQKRIEAALRELGEPQPGYPAPVVNAIQLLREAFREGV